MSKQSGRGTAWRMPILAVVAALVAAACSSGDATPTSTTAPVEPSSTVAEAEAEVEVEGPLLADADFSDVDAVIDSFVADEGLNGAALIVVDPDEGFVHEHYAGEFSPDRVSLVASSSKMVTAGVLVHLAEQGLLDLDAPVADVVPWGAANPDITVAQLLSNSSGLLGLEPMPTFPPYLCQFLAVGTLEECGEAIFTTTGDDALVVPPDTEFRYGGAQWQVAGAVAEAVSGRTWAELVDEVYVEPCGLDTFGYNNHFTQVVNPAGPFRYPTQFGGDPSVLAPTLNPNMEGGLYTTPTDYATLLQMYLRGGLCGEERVFSEESIERLTSDRAGAAYGGPDTGRFDGYGLGWWIDSEAGVVEDGGAFGAAPWLDLGRGYGAYLVIEDRSAVGQRLANVVRPLIEAHVDATRGG